jgi:two-component FAD-dependent monooxygenase
MTGHADRPPAGSPFDYPLSSRMAENDAILVLDKVLIPRENVFISGSLKGIAVRFFRALYLPRCARLAVKPEFIAWPARRVRQLTIRGRHPPATKGYPREGA